MKRITKKPKNIPFLYNIFFADASLSIPLTSLLLHPKPKLSLSLFFNFILFTFVSCAKEGKNSKMSKKRTRTTTAASSKGNKKPRILPPSPHGPFWNGTTRNKYLRTGAFVCTVVKQNDKYTTALFFYTKVIVRGCTPSKYTIATAAD